jgi:hypothetical protein
MNFKRLSRSFAIVACAVFVVACSDDPATTTNNGSANNNNGTMTNNGTMNNGGMNNGMTNNGMANNMNNGMTNNGMSNNMNNGSNNQNNGTPTENPIAANHFCAAAGVSSGNGVQAIHCLGPADIGAVEATGSGYRWQPGAAYVVLGN